MSFLSFTFAIFLLCALFVYYIAPKKYQWIVLLAANTVFYLFSGIAHIVFIVASSLITFFGAKIVSDINEGVKAQKKELSKDDFKALKAKAQNKKRLVLVAMLILNVGILLYLKYFRRKKLFQIFCFRFFFSAAAFRSNKSLQSNGISASRKPQL